VVPGGTPGASAGVFNALGGPNAILPAPNHKAGLAPSTLRVEVFPVISAAGAASLATGLSASVAAAPDAIVPTVTPIISVAATVPADTLQALRTGVASVSAASKSNTPGASRAALDAVFEDSLTRPEALAVSVRSAASDSPRLDLPESREPAKGPRWVKGFRPGGTPPASSLKRTLSVGFLAAVIPLAITIAAISIALFLGYKLHSNYYNGSLNAEAPAMIQAAASWVGAAVMAPISEEAIFRGGMQGTLAKITKKLHLRSFVVPALITSLLFVAIHETADPLLFSTRLVHSMILGYTYAKEGILAAMAAHGFFNGLLALSVVFTALGLPWLGLATEPVALYFAYKSYQVLKAQKLDIASGALAPKRMSSGLAFAFAVILLAGYYLLMPNIMWLVGAVALMIRAILKLKK
jgi:membrane protease YdiL (CAAX protease family)